MNILNEHLQFIFKMNINRVNYLKTIKQQNFNNLILIIDVIIGNLEHFTIE